MIIAATFAAVLFSAAAAAPPLPATEAGHSKEAEVKVEETILVTATRAERALSELPVSATVVTAERLQSAPVRSVDDMLRSIAGVQPSIVSSSGSTPTNQRFSMHGLGGTRALVLLDGIPLHDAYSGLVQWQRVPMDTLRQVEVVRGGNASLFGTFALGGTVNLITRPAEANVAAADLSYGSFGTTRSSLRVEHTVGPRLALRVTHHAIDTSGFDRVPNPGPIDVPAWGDSASTAARGDFLVSDLTRAFLTTSAGRFDISQGTPSTYSKRDAFDAAAGLDHASATSGAIVARMFYQRQNERLTNSSLIGDRVSEFLSQDALIPSNAVGGTIEWSRARVGSIPFVSLGADVRQVTASESRMTFNRAGNVTQRNSLQGRQRFAGVFAQASWEPSARIEVLASGRFDFYRNQDGTDAIAGGARTVYPDTSSLQFDPRISVRYSLGSTSAVRASAYRAFNAPTLRDLYRNSQTGNSLLLGNPSLEPETLTGGEIGVERAGSRGRVELNFYRNVVDGLQSRAPVAGRGPNVTQYVNAGKARSQGVEMILAYTIAKRWSADASYTYADSIVTDDPSPQLRGKRIADVPRDAGSLSMRYHGDRGTTFEVRGRSVGRCYGDATGTALSPAHRVVDLSLTQAVRPWADVYLVGENIFDELYYQALAVNSFRTGLPRSITAGIRVRTAW